MNSIRKTLLLPLLILTFSSSVWAGESLFSRAYTTETVPGGHFELEQAIRNRWHRAQGDYNAVDLISEFEYGVTDAFQLAFYVDTGYLHAKNTTDDNDPAIMNGGLLSRDGFALQSLSAEFLYRFISPVGHPLGVALSLEPEIFFVDLHNGHQENGSFGNELRLILQKNMLEDQLILAYNVVLEAEYFRYGNMDTAYQGELDWNNELGASYRLTSNWYGGLEFRNHNEVGNFWHHDHSVFWAGPVIHYGGERFWATLGALYQISGVPHGTDDDGTVEGDSSHFLHSHELWETTLKVSWAF
jgi:hypothetical protein